MSSTEENKSRVVTVHHGDASQEVRFFPGTPARVLQATIFSLFDLDPEVLKDCQVIWQMDDGVPLVFFPAAFPKSVRLCLVVGRPDGTRLTGRHRMPDSEISEQQAAKKIKTTHSTSSSSSSPDPKPKPNDPTEPWLWDPASIRGHGRNVKIADDGKGKLLQSFCNDGAGAVSGCVAVNITTGKWRWKFVMLPFTCCGGITLVPSADRASSSTDMRKLDTWGREYASGTESNDSKSANVELHCSVDLSGDRMLRVRLGNSGGKLLKESLVEGPAGTAMSPAIVWKHNSHCRIEGPIACE